MRLQAQLTVGWRDGPETEFAATKLHKSAQHADEDYAKALASSLESAGNKPISGLERLFRRRTGGFEKIKKFIGALASLPHSTAYADPIICRIDAFAYAFLRGAKNIDILLSPGDEVNTEYRKTRVAWSSLVTSLENFERTGIPLAKGTGVSSGQYLALRGVVSRPSARDERRALATLMVSGPSSMQDISHDLGLNYSLGERTVAAFFRMGVVERRSGEIFAVEESALPLAAFGLRETMGLDLLNMLP